MDMNVTTERLDNCQVRVVIEVDRAEIDKKLRQTARTISRTVNIPGYRRGRAPYLAVARLFGLEALRQQALEEFGNELLEQGLDQVEYESYDVGELEEITWDPFRMTVLIPISPEVELGDYRAVRVPLEPEPITDEKVEARLAAFQREYTQWMPVERPAEFGDQIVADFEGKAGDELIMSNENYEILLEEGGEVPLPGFHAEVVGMAPGEEKTFTLTVPEDDYEEEARGQEAVVTVRVHTVREEDVPPLDDELAMMVGDYDTLDELRAALREEMETNALQTAEAEYLDKILEAMIDAADQLEYPPQAVDREADLSLEQMEQNLAAQGVSLDQFLGMANKTREMYKEELRPSSEVRLRKRLVLNRIAELEHVAVSEDEVDAEIERLIEAAGEDAEQMREVLEREDGRLTVKNELLMNKLEERLRQIVQGEAPPLEEKEDETEGEAEVEAEAGEEVAETGEPA